VLENLNKKRVHDYKKHFYSTATTTVTATAMTTTAATTTITIMFLCPDAAITT
jgi:hypothetical protein